ncbi:hypothetical protein TNCT_393181 [Trichonephila clavata]|uniref:Uncharacterized protein n=1 Tax=Trichonephila clavata TaxID=2740835 RepID=A0A8X6I1D8_TRICU|nr:hypothetical protein TNCT_393181 [Trichonephila clavata]
MELDGKMEMNPPARKFRIHQIGLCDGWKESENKQKTGKNQSGRKKRCPGAGKAGTGKEKKKKGGPTPIGLGEMR